MASDQNHTKAKQVIASITGGDISLVISSLTILEIYSVVSRRLHQVSWIEPLKGIVNTGSNESERKIILASMIVSYMKERLNLRIVDDDSELIPFADSKFQKLFSEGIANAPKFALKTLDLLQLTRAAALIPKAAFVTLDDDFSRYKNEIKNTFEMEVFP